MVLKGNILLLHTLCTTVGGNYIPLYLLILYLRKLRMTLCSMFSSEYFLYISFVANNKVSIKGTQNKFQSGPVCSRFLRRPIMKDTTLIVLPHFALASTYCTRGKIADI